MDIKLFKAAIKWMIGQVPLLGAAYASWLPIQQNPVVALLLAVLYEIVFALFAFGRSFVGKVWAQLEPDMVKASVDWVRAMVRGFAPGFRKRYNQQVIYDHRVFNVRGLRTQGSFTLALEKVFVGLRIAPGNVQNATAAAIPFKPLYADLGNGPQTIWAFLHAMQNTPCTALAIIGPPGSGKTTLLQHIALIFASNRQRRQRMRAYTPVMLFLRDHYKKIVADSPNLGDLAQAYFSDAKRYPELKPPIGWFAHQLSAGKCMVLLDGLDEVDTADNRRKVAAWVDQQIKNYPKCLFVLSARPPGYKDAPLQHAHVLEVQSFSAAQVREFVHNWYLANEVMSNAGKVDAGVRQEATRRADDLLTRLQQLPALNELTVNPLLLTMIATVHRYRGQLPGRRVELYSEICDVLLGHRRQAVGVIEPLSAAQKRVALQPLAHHMATSKQLEIKETDAADIVAPYLARLGLNDEASKTFFKEVEASSGLFVESELGKWRFAHKTFLEYLTAAHWVEENTAQDWAHLVSDSWWHETLRLYAAQRDGSAIAEACLNERSTPAWLLAVDLREEARELTATIRQRIDDTLRDDLESPDAERFKRAAEMLLSKRLRRLQALPAPIVLDDEWITCAEYQVFLDAMRAQGQFYQPDHWTQWRFASGQAQTPIAGMRFEAAQAFCAWLSQRQNQEVMLQLPKWPNEASQMVDMVAIPMGWWTSQKKVFLPRTAKIDLDLFLQSAPSPPPLNEIVAHARIRFHTSIFVSSIFTNGLINTLVGIFASGPNGLTNALTNALNQWYAYDLDLARALARALAFDRPRDLTRILVRELDSALDLALDLARDLTRDRNLASDFKQTLGIALDLGLPSILGLYLASDRASQTNYTELIIKLAALSTISDQQLRQKMLLGAILKLLQKTDQASFNVAAWRKAMSEYVCLLAEYMWLGLQEIRQADKKQGWFGRLTGKTSNIKKLNAAEDYARRLYWQMKVLLLREEGKLPAWEGIRLERVRGED